MSENRGFETKSSSEIRSSLENKGSLNISPSVTKTYLPSKNQQRELSLATTEGVQETSSLEIVPESEREFLEKASKKIDYLAWFPGVHPDDLADTRQEILLKLWRSCVRQGRLQATGTFLTQAISWHRYDDRGRRRRIEEAENGFATQYYGDIQRGKLDNKDVIISTRTSSPEDEAIFKSKSTEFLRNLSLRRRELLRMDWQGYSVKTIAKHLNMTVAAVRKDRQRMLEKLRNTKEDDTNGRHQPKRKRKGPGSEKGIP